MGSALFYFTVGPFQNWDTGYEFQAATGVLKWGVPYTGGAGSMINQPPLGFYIDSTVFRVFGSSFNTGVAVITCFGSWLRLAGLLNWQSLVRQNNRAGGFSTFCLNSLASGFRKNLPNRRTMPILQPTFPINRLLRHTQRLNRALHAVSGLFRNRILNQVLRNFHGFPLGNFLFPRQTKKAEAPVGSFCFLLADGGVLAGLVSGRLRNQHLDDFLAGRLQILQRRWLNTHVFFHLQLSHRQLRRIHPWLAAAISLFISVFYRKTLKNLLASDAVCLAAIVVVLGLDAFLALGLNYRAPYTGLVKYGYQSLPFICLLAGSLVIKSQTLRPTVKTEPRRNWVFFGIALAGAVSVAVALFLDFYHAQLYSQLKNVAFTVEGQVSYSFSNSAPITAANSLVYVQYLGFALILLGLVWAAKANC